LPAENNVILYPREVEVFSKANFKIPPSKSVVEQTQNNSRIGLVKTGEIPEIGVLAKFVTWKVE
jgi:hypothetical protein